MGALRVTQRMLIDRVLGNLNSQSLRILELQEQLATGRVVNRPSDNPLAARRAVNAREEIARIEQYLTNISTIRPTLLESETAIRTVVDIFQRATELAIQGSSDTNGQLQRDQIATEINQLLESTLGQANNITAGRYIFGGTRTLTKPFETTRDSDDEVIAVTYQGNDDHFEIDISDNTRVRVNETGHDVFASTAPGGADIFQILIDLRDNLRAGDTPAMQDRLAELGEAQDQLLLATARIGATSAGLERVDANLRDVTTQLEQVLSDSVDADFAEVIVNLNAQSNAYQASLNAAARVIQPSLLDFV